MLRPGYQEKEEESSCDEVPSIEEADPLINSVKEYPVVKMKHLRNYKVGDVVRLKLTGELVEIEHTGICTLCVFYWKYGLYGSCGIETRCYGYDGEFGGNSVYFLEVKEE